MENLPTQNLSSIEQATLKDYGDEYPIIFYEPEIKSEEKKDLKELIQDNNSLVLFTEPDEALRWALKLTQDLGISFILLTSNENAEQAIIQKFGSLKDTFPREMFDFEQEDLLKDLFKEASFNLINSHKIKAYVFITKSDFMNEAPVDEKEEEVMMMPSVKEMAKNFRKEYDVIWYDPFLSSENKEALTKAVDIEEENIYKDFQELNMRIHDTNSPPYHLIMTGGDNAKQVIQDMSQFGNTLLCLYIYSDDSEIIEAAEQNPNILVEKSLEDLIPKIAETIIAKLDLNYNLPAFATSFDTFDKSHFYYLHYYLKGLINFQNREQAKADFLKLAQTIEKSKKLAEFDKKYKKYDQTKILFWYTVNCPIFKVLNNCLRIATSDSILYCRFILKDLERAIREKHQEASEQYNGVVYRGAFISQVEWEKLRANVGKDIEMYGFISTSLELEVARKFFDKNLEQKLLIRIVIPPLPLIPNLDKQGFVDLSKISSFKKQKEILFNVRSKFRILETEENAKIQFADGTSIECRHLVLLYGPQLLKKSITLSQPRFTVEIELETGKMCDTCGLKKELYGFNSQEGNGSHIRCLKCLSDNIPKDVALVDLDFVDNSEEDSSDFEDNFEPIRYNINGRIEKYGEKVDLPFYGYKCQSCQERRKQTYYRWKNSVTREMFEQCSDCFKLGKKIEADILIAETNPYVWWHEGENEWEAADSKFQGILSEVVKYQSQADVYMEVQRFEECIQYGKRVCQKLNKKRRRENEKLVQYEKSGKAYDKMGKYQEALRCHKEVLKIREAMYGEHVWTATSYNNIGSVYRSLGQYTLAIDSHLKALNIRETQLGEDHPETIISYNNLASVYENMGKLEEAQELFEKALNLRKRVLGAHPLTANLESNLAAVYQRLGEYHKALYHMRNALEARLAVFGEQHSETANSYNNLGSISSLLKDHQESEKNYKKALQIWRNIYKEPHPSVATALQNLAEVSCILENYQDALEGHKEALRIRKNLFEEKHPDIALSYYHLGATYGNLEDYEEALEYYKKALKLRKDLDGKDHLNTAHVYHNIGYIYYDLASLGEVAESKAINYETAFKYFNKALGIAEGAPAKNGLSLVGFYYDLGVINAQMNSNESALDFFFKAFETAIVVYKGNYAILKKDYNFFISWYQSDKVQEDLRDKFSDKLRQEYFNRINKIYETFSQGELKREGDEKFESKP